MKILKTQVLLIVKSSYLFLLMAPFSVHSSISLIKIIEHFDHLKQMNVNNSDILQQCEAYCNACNNAFKNLKNNRPVADHVWYRAEIAKTIYQCGFGLFKNNIEKYLFDWSALACITHKKVDYWQEFPLTGQQVMHIF